MRSRGTRLDRHYKSMEGRRFGLLVLVDSKRGRNSWGARMGLFRCDCGRDHITSLSGVTSGGIRSCGCRKGKNSKHGLRSSPVYQTWINIKKRCFDSSASGFDRYGACGIVMCTEWANSFEAFYAHVGDRPTGASIDRIDNARGYEPGNVRWASARQQAENRRTTRPVVVHGHAFRSMAAAGRHLGVTTQTVKMRCERGEPGYEFVEEQGARR